MSTQINDVVVVNITRETAKLSRAGFGTPLLMHDDVGLPTGEMLTFSDASDVLALNDAITTSSEVYKAAVALTSQALKPEQFKVWKKNVDSDAEFEYKFDIAATAGTYTLTLQNPAGTQSTTATIAYDATALQIATAIDAAVGSSTSLVVIDVADKEFTVAFSGGDANTDYRLISCDVSGLTTTTSVEINVVAYGSATETWDTALNAAIAADNDWYCLLTETRTEADILLLAAIIETERKIYLADTEDAAVLAGTAGNVAEDLKGLSYDRTAVSYVYNSGDYQSAAWAGGQLPEDPGSITWKFKTLSGITPGVFTTTQLTALDSNNVNYYETVAGLNIVSSEAIMASGEYIDVIRGQDQLQADIEEDVFTLLASSKKVPYTQAGIDAVRGVLSAAIQKSVNRGYIASGSVSITVPKIEDVASADKTARLLQNITFSATIAGAVHKTIITGTLTV